MLGITSHDLPFPMPWRRCANTIGGKWVFASPIAKSRDKNYPASCANASPMHSAGRLDGQSRAERLDFFLQFGPSLRSFLQPLRQWAGKLISEKSEEGECRHDHQGRAQGSGNSKSFQSTDNRREQEIEDHGQNDGKK